MKFDARSTRDRMKWCQLETKIVESRENNVLQQDAPREVAQMKAGFGIQRDAKARYQAELTVWYVQIQKTVHARRSITEVNVARIVREVTAVV